MTTPHNAGREMPRRIQRKRTKGWRMPEGTVYVGRGSTFGNPWIIGQAIVLGCGERRQVIRSLNAQQAVDLYRLWIMHADVNDRNNGPANPDRLKWQELRGKNLACWCPPDQPCHADVLLELANRI